MSVHLGEKEHKLLLYTEKLYAIIGSSYFIVKVGYANHHTGIFLFALVVRFVGGFWNVAGFGAGLVIRIALFAPLSPLRY